MNLMIGAKTMKKIITLVSALAIVAMAAVSCSLEEQNVQEEIQNTEIQMVEVQFGAESVDPVATKATLTPNDSENAFAAAWDNGDQIDIAYMYQNYETEEEDYGDATASWNGSYFVTTLPQKSAAAWNYGASYPKKNSYGSIKFDGNRIQKGNNYNSLYDVMLSSVNVENAIQGKDDDGNNIVFPMVRQTAIAYFHLTSSLNEPVLSATLKANDGFIATQYAYISGGAFIPSNGSAEEGALDEITIEFEEGTAPSAQDFTLWFNVLPTIYQSMSLKIETEHHECTISKGPGNDYYMYEAGKLYKVKSNIDSKWQEKGGDTPFVSSYELITSTSDIKPGKYIIAAKVGEQYIAMTKDIEAKIVGEVVTVSSNQIAAADGESYAWVLEYCNDGYSIYNGASFLTYSSSTNLGSETEAYEWTIKEATTHGSFRVAATTGTNRGLLYRAGDINKFGGYSTTNVSDSGEYYDVELFKYRSSGTTEETYTVSVADIVGGSVSVSPASAKEGAIISLTATPNENYAFSSWNVTNDTTQEVITVTDDQFTMPASNVTVSATFVESQTGDIVFTKYSGDIVEGDYIIYSDGGAMNTTVSSNRLQYMEVAVANSQIINPDASIIWHIAKSGEYWTIFNESDAKYAASTSSKNQATTTNDGTSDNAKWSVSYDENYIFVNYARGKAISDPNNKYLRRNDSYGFACYALSTGTAPELYKKGSSNIPPTIATPQFSIPGGSYYEAQTIELTCSTEGATIYYSLNDSVYTEYTSAISIAETTTVNAYAQKAEVTSEIVSATYTIVTLPVLTTVQEIFEKATDAGNTATPVKVTFNNWVVSGIKNNSSSSDIYVTDGTKGFIIYASSDHGFEVGDILSGTAVECKVQLYNKSAEIKDITSSSSGLTVTNGGVLTPYFASIADLSGVNTGALISINNVTFNGTEFADNDSNKIKPFNSLFNYSALTSGQKYNVTGVYLQYNSTKEILPRSADDISEVVATKYAINIDTNIQNGTVTASATEAAEGVEITLTPTNESGYHFAAWDVKDASNNPIVVNNNNTFTMPASAVTVSAIFEKDSDDQPTPHAFTFSEVASQKSWENGVAQTDVTIDETHFVVSGGGNNGKYYTSDTTWRFYSGGGLTISVSGGKKITSVVSNPSQTFTISDNGEATISFSGTVKFKSITVYY